MIDGKKMEVDVCKFYNIANYPSLSMYRNSTCKSKNLFCDK